MLLLQILFILGFILGIRLMNSPKTAVAGNLIGALSMFGAIIMTLAETGILNVSMLWAGLLVGSALGVWLALKVLIIQMPQMVALLNGLGGGASALVALVLALQASDLTAFTWFTTSLAMIVGAITLSGSLVAAAKLHGKLHQRPLHFKGHNLYLWLSLALLAISTTSLILGSRFVFVHTLILLGASLLFGGLFTLRVGGADMPITISLLNSLSGVAGSVAGFALANGTLLVVIGSIVGASGLILTQIMCRAMNRKLWQILMGKTTQITTKEPQVQPVPKGSNRAKSELTWERALREAQSIAIIPGYGMALAQAQLQVKQVSALLQTAGKEVRFGIHPVAGRMPGHMNVLLAEVDIPYEDLYELAEINEFLKTADLAIIIGANDVVNPAAVERTDTPISGMPIIQADLARQVLVCNFDAKPGYAGVENSLYNKENVHLLLGDAKDSLQQISGILENEGKLDLRKGTELELDPAVLLSEAKRVVLVPGYGMALAQAQGEVKQVIDTLQQRGIEVQMAIHPVAGRMPGHMNVLLAEVDVPYDLMYEMDQMNSEFKNVDVVVVIGANDVVNPAANTHADTPIYGMPVLQVVDARHVIVYNLDRSPGYAGVENTLYDLEHCIFVPGDAGESLRNLLLALRSAA